MLLNAIRYHLAAMSRRKTTAATFLILFGAVVINFITNMLHNAKTGYITDMYDPIKLLTLSTWSSTGYFLFIFFPFLVILPTSLSYLWDRNTGMKTYIQTRCGRRAYWYGQLLAVFIITFILFSLPFLIELALNCICFDLRSNGDPSNISYFSYILAGDSFFMDGLFLKHKVIYGILYILIFAFVSGILAVFNYVVSSLPFMKFKIFAFFPIYCLFFLLAFLSKYINFDFELNYYLILQMFSFDINNNYAAYGIFLLLLIVISIYIINIQVRKDNNL